MLHIYVCGHALERAVRKTLESLQSDLNDEAQGLLHL